MFDAIVEVGGRILIDSHPPPAEPRTQAWCLSQCDVLFGRPHRLRMTPPQEDLIPHMLGTQGGICLGDGGETLAS